MEEGTKKGTAQPAAAARKGKQAPGGRSGSKKRDLAEVSGELEMHQIELELQGEELLRTRQELEEMLAQYTELYDLAPVGYFSLDFSGEIKAVNLAGAALLGLERTMVIGRVFQGLVVHRDRSAFEAFLAATRTARHKQELELGLVQFREEVPRLVVKLEAQPGSTGSTCLVAVIDITAKKQAEEELERYREQLEWLVGERTHSLETEIAERKRAELEIMELNATLERRVAERTGELQATVRDLQTFSYSVSHDLRAPLRSINSFASILLEEYGERLDAEGQRLLGTIVKRTVSMGTLIDDLLSFTRNSRQQVALETIDMTALARELVEKISGNGAHRAAAEFRVPELPEARADRAMISQVLENLLTNALKFSSRSEHPLVELGGEVQERELVYYVRDNGVGFDMKYADAIFGVFQRLQHAESFEGTGVGLAIVEQVITKHGGRVWAEARPGAGATFYFSLPRR